MPYHIAIPQGDKFIISSKEAFNVRSNAFAHAKRMGLEKVCFICTDEQKALIEAGTEFDSTVINASSPPVINAVTPVNKCCRVARARRHMDERRGHPVEQESAQHEEEEIDVSD